MGESSVNGPCSIDLLNDQRSCWFIASKNLEDVAMAKWCSFGRSKQHWGSQFSKLGLSAGNHPALKSQTTSNMGLSIAMRIPQKAGWFLLGKIPLIEMDGWFGWGHPYDETETSIWHSGQQMRHDKGMGDVDPKIDQVHATCMTITFFGNSTVIPYVLDSCYLDYCLYLNPGFGLLLKSF